MWPHFRRLTQCQPQNRSAVQGPVVSAVVARVGRQSSRPATAAVVCTVDRPAAVRQRATRTLLVTMRNGGTVRARRHRKAEARERHLAIFLTSIYYFTQEQLAKIKAIGATYEQAVEIAHETWRRKVGLTGPPLSLSEARALVKNLKRKMREERHSKANREG
jgi:hypothetical protein